MNRPPLPRVPLTLLATAALLLALAAPALAHNLTVTPPGATDAKIGWVGGHALPESAAGQGLSEVGGGPDVGAAQPAAHDRGLNSACAALDATGNGVVDIRGPGPSCPHGQ